MRRWKTMGVHLSRTICQYDIQCDDKTGWLTFFSHPARRIGARYLGPAAIEVSSWDLNQSLFSQIFPSRSYGLWKISLWASLFKILPHFVLPTQRSHEAFKFIPPVAGCTNEQCVSRQGIQIPRLSYEGNISFFPIITTKSLINFYVNEFGIRSFLKDSKS